MRLSDIDLKLLRVFQAVAETGGFGKAQGRLGISQPAISAQIAKLEDRLGFRLCERGPQGFALTREGDDVLTEANQLLAFMDQSADRLRDIGTVRDKRIRFGVVDSMVTDQNNPLVDIIRALKTDDSNLKVHIGIYDFLDCLSELRADRLDIALVGIAGDELIPDEIEAMPLYEEMSGLYCTPDHPCCGITDKAELKQALAEAEISAHSFVFNPIDHDLAPKLLDQSKGVAQDTIELSTYLALSGSHVGLIPTHYAQAWVTSGDLVRIAPETYAVQSLFHGLRLRARPHDEICKAAWNALAHARQTKG